MENTEIFSSLYFTIFDIYISVDKLEGAGVAQSVKQLG
jgi:hypothetical protein